MLVLVLPLNTDTITAPLAVTPPRLRTGLSLSAVITAAMQTNVDRLVK